jgi:flagellar hook-length control protein FliK
MPLRPHTAATDASGSAPFTVPQTLPAATGTAHHTAPKETAPASGVLAPVAEGIFVRLGSLRTTPSSSSFHVVLQPQALGTVSVHVQRGQDGLQVTLIPQQSATREILDRHMHELVTALGAADGAAPRVSVVAPGAASSGSFGGADQGMLGSGAFSAGAGGQQPSQGQGAQGEPSSWDDTARPPLTAAPMGAPAPRRAPLAAQRLANASRVDFQA